MVLLAPQLRLLTIVMARFKEPRKLLVQPHLSADARYST